jgi:hypothetical protein
MFHLIICFCLLISCAPKTIPLTSLEQQQAFELFDRHLLAIGGAQQMKMHQSYSLKGSIKEVSSNKTHEYYLQQRAPNLYYIRINVIGIGIFERGYDGSVFWERTPRGAALLTEEEQNKMLPVVDFYQDLNYKTWYSEIHDRQEVSFAGQVCDMLDVTTYNGKKEQIFFSQETGLRVGIVRMIGTDEEIIIRYGHYLDKEGLKIPVSKEEKMGDIHRVWIIDQFVWDKTDADFNLPPSLQGER